MEYSSKKCINQRYSSIAKLVGIRVEYVNPAYTSQKCPVCGDIHHANDRQYTCDCGFHIHRDLLDAMNICNSTENICQYSLAFGSYPKNVSSSLTTGIFGK